MTTQRHRIIVEGNDATNYSAYSPDLPGVVATGATRTECERELRDAIEFHLEGLTTDEPADAAGTAMPLLTFEGVSKSYETAGQKLVLLNRVSFEIPAGAIVGILGTRRSGKSTLLRLMADLEQPDSGVVRFEGHDITSMPWRKRERLVLGRILLASPQDWPSLGGTVRDEVEMSLLNRRLSGRDIRSRTQHLLERVELTEHANERVNSLSLVDRPRAILAQALAIGPSLLLMDEPAVMPSRRESERFLELLRSVASEAHMTLVIASEEVAMLSGVEPLLSIEEGEIRSLERKATVIDFPKRSAAGE